MKRSSERILVSHTGNLPRPDDLQALVDEPGTRFSDRLGTRNGHAEITGAKLEAMAEGARLASQALYARS